MESIETLLERYNNDAEHPTYKVDMWTIAVGMKETRQGYWDWVKYRLECEQEQIDGIPFEELPIHVSSDEYSEEGNAYIRERLETGK